MVGLVVPVGAAGAEVVVGAVFAVVAVVVSLADKFAGGKFVAADSLLRGLDSFVYIEVFLTIDKLRGNLDPIVQAGSFLEIEAAVDEGVVDAGNGKLDGGGILRHGQLQGSELQVGLGAYGVGFGVVVAEMGAFEGGGLATEPVGLDVAANHVHIGTLPPPYFEPKVVMAKGLRTVESRKVLILKGRLL